MFILWSLSQLSDCIRTHSIALSSLGISSYQEENPAGFIPAVTKLGGQHELRDQVALGKRKMPS